VTAEEKPQKGRARPVMQEKASVLMWSGRSEGARVVTFSPVSALRSPLIKSHLKVRRSGSPGNEVKGGPHKECGKCI
jgi:hypothetical protein